MMVVDLSGSKMNFGQVSDQMKQVGEELGMNINMQRMDIFDAMHKV